MLRKKMDPKRSALLFSILSLLVVVPSVGFAQTETVLYTFAGMPDGAWPSTAGPLAIDSAGNLYGTTMIGGTVGYGSVFEVPAGGGERLLYSFAGKSDGSSPVGGVILSGGALYGTTEYGGEFSSKCKAGCGTVFKVSGTGAYTVAHSFTGPTSDGAYPFGGVISDAAGNLYGTTTKGGIYKSYGTVFELTVSGSERLYSLKHSPDGEFPWGSLSRDSSGNLYGTTEYGGANNCPNATGTCGAAFEVSATGESIIYSFGNSSTDGVYPESGLVGDDRGNFYGTTAAGGKYGYGTVFKLSKTTGTWKETILYNFTGLADGAYPSGRLIIDAQGNLYGTTPGGGAYTCGTVFRVAPNGEESVLYSFTGLADGDGPAAGLVADKQGNLYGTTTYGGSASYSQGWGVVFKITP